MYRWFVFFCCVTIATCISQGLFVDQTTEYFETCRNETDRIGNITVVYFELRSNTFNNATMILKDDLYLNYSKNKYDKLMLVSCLCTKLKINTYEFFVSPIHLNEMTDALTLCVYHDDNTPIEEVIQVPKKYIKIFMMARYSTLMPRNVDNFALNKNASSDCLNIMGLPSSRLPGQNTCFYYSYVSFIEKNNYTSVIEEKSYYGPFLATNLPNFTTASEMFFNNSVTKMYDFAAELGFVTCAVYKNKTRLDVSKFKRCYTKYVETKLEDLKLRYSFIITACCCIMHVDKDCEFVSNGLKENKTLCYNGTLTQSNDSFFATDCGAEISREYKRLYYKNVKSGNGVSKATAGENSSVVFGDVKHSCDSNTVVCNDNQVIFNRVRCCDSNHFCNYASGMNVVQKHCLQSFGEKKKEYGCPLVMYKTNGIWTLASPLWFDVKKSTLIDLYSDVYTSPQNSSEQFNFKAILGYLYYRKVDRACEKLNGKQPNMPYFVLSCFSDKNCDWHFLNENFLTTSFEKKLLNSLTGNNVTYCEKGVMDAKEVELHRVSFHKSNTTRELGLYCQVKMEIEEKTNNNSIRISFGPIFPKPNCNRTIVKTDSIWMCCYNASANHLSIDSECHYSTFWMKYLQRQNHESLPENTDILVKQKVYDFVDECQQRRVGVFGKKRKRCTPGGYGCFHLLHINREKTEVIASCLGHGERKIATEKISYDAFGAALICSTPESADICQIIHLNGEIYFVCCCHIKTKNNRLQICETNSEQLFHHVNHDLKKIGRFQTT